MKEPSGSKSSAMNAAEKSSFESVSVTAAVPAAGITSKTFAAGTSDAKAANRNAKYKM